MRELIESAAEALICSSLSLALTGAGISVESGIPDFRSAGGLWSKYDPAAYATIDAFRSNPERVWEMLREMNKVVGAAKPNNAHLAMGELETMGHLHWIITQNIDNLHQAGGTRNIIEYHGNSSTLSCLWCGKRYRTLDKSAEYPPRCVCSKVLKPDVVFFGEAIPAGAMEQSYDLVSRAKVLLVVGTSAVVSPVNAIPGLAKRNGATVVEINKERTHLTESVTDIFCQGSAGKILPEIVQEVRRKTGKTVLTMP